jgi:hypothetical protein
MTQPAFDRVLALTRVPALASLLPDELASLAERLEERALSPHEVCTDGDETAVCLLHSGALSVGDEGRRVDSPALVGLVEALARESLTLRAGASGARVSLLARDDLEWVMEDVYEVWIAMLRHAAGRWLDAEPRLADAPRVVRPRGREAPSSLFTRIQLLSEIDLFRELRPMAVGRLAKAMQECSFQAGEELWDEASASEACFVVVSGRFGTDGQDADDAAGEATRGGPGAVLGLRAALAGRARNERVTALSESRALRLKIGALIDELEDDPSGAIAMLESLAHRVLRAEAAA